MAKIKEFHGVRPPKDLVDKVAELPYDVCNSKEAKIIAEGNPYNFYHISKPEIDLPEDVNPYSEEVYQKAKENLQNFEKEGIILEDKEESFYFYTLEMQGRVQNGLVSCVSIDDYINNVVKKHEYTREEKENDRIKHLNVLNAQTGLVFLLYKEEGAGRSLWEQILKIDPEYDFRAKDGVRHTFRKINDGELKNELKEFFKNKDLYIADGHHRAASAVKNGLQRRNDNSNNSGDEEYNYFLSVIFPHDELFIMPYNRVCKDLNGMTKEIFFEKVSESFLIKESDVKIPEKKSTFSMYIDEKWYTIEPLESVGNDPVQSLDVSILQDRLLDPLLDIKDPRKSNRIDFIGGIRGTDELERLVNSTDYEVAFSMFPTTVNDLINVSDSGNVMPPKSTWFEPKLRSGMIIHKI